MACAHDEPQPPAELHLTAAPEDDPTCLIGELQSALGPLLLARKDRYTPPAPIIRPKWTGAFHLFSFPRELRDRIYFHHLYRPKGVVYKRKTGQQWPFNQDGHIVSLFLTSRQVYEEALQVYARYNEFRFEDYGRWHRKKPFKGIEGKLRLLPDAHMSLLQKVTRNYGGHDTAMAWVQMMHEAILFKSYCPKLREFTACWSIYSFIRDAGIERLEKPAIFAETTDEAKVQTWLDLLRRMAHETNLAPPGWIKIRISNSWQPQDPAVNTAYARLVKEFGIKDVEYDMEQSGRKWLEESWSDGERRRRKGEPRR